MKTRDELLQLLDEAVTNRRINVAAIKLLLEERRRDEDGGPVSGFDELDGDDNVVPLKRAG